MNGRLPRLTPVLILLATVLFAARGVYNLSVLAANDVSANPNTGILDTQPAPQTEEPTAGDRLLIQAIAQLERRDSVQARLRHQVSLEGRHLSGSGSYLQQGSGEGLRLRLELKIAGQDSSLLQVSNTRHLWLDRQVPTGRTITRIDLRQLKADPVLAFTGAAPPAGTSWSSTGSILPSGGLPNLLASLREHFTFLPPQAMRLAVAPPTTSQPASIPVFAVVGHWKSAKLASLLSNGRDKILQAVPGRIPQEVLLLVGQADLFPYRIEYRKLETHTSTDSNGAVVPYQLSARPMVVLELSDVAFDVPIARGEFDYAPGDADWVDHTLAVMEQLRREQQHKAAPGAAEQPIVSGRDQQQLRN